MSQAIRLGLALALICAPAGSYALALGAITRNFGVCAATTITNAGNTVVTGSIGVSPGSSITGFPPGTATTIEVTTVAAANCEAQAGTTYNTCKGLATTTDLSGTPLGGLTLLAGVYNFATTAALSGTLKLNAAGNANAQFIFKIGTAFSTTSSSKVTLINGAKACNVFWCVGSSAAIADLNVFNGPLIAYTSISVGEATTDVGGFFALNGGVTLLNDKVTKSGTTC